MEQETGGVPIRYSLFAMRPPMTELSQDTKMHAYRTHTCGQLRPTDVGSRVRLSGWVHRARDHGGLLFIDLRDHYGLTQCVIEPDSPAFARPARRVRNGC